MIFRNLTNKKRALSVALLLTVCALLFGCDGVGSQTDVTTPPTETTAPLVGMHQLNILEKGPLYMEVGDTITLTTDAPEELRDSLIWVSSAPCVGVTNRGVITAQVLGNATVTVEYHGFTDGIGIFVVEELPTRPAETTPDETTPAESVPSETAPSEPDPSETDSAETDPSESESEAGTEFDPDSVSRGPKRA